MKFCDKCGICCTLFDLLELPEEYQKLNDGSGRCKYLIGNLCSIYDNRPLLCNSTWVYAHFYANTYSWDEYVALTTQRCVVLKERYGVIN